MHLSVFAKADLVKISRIYTYNETGHKYESFIIL